MKKVTIEIDKKNVLAEVDKHANYMTERSDSETAYDMVRLYEEKHESLEEAYDEAVGMILKAVKLYVKEAKQYTKVDNTEQDKVKLTLSMPSSYNDALTESVTKEAEAVAIHNMLRLWYSIVLPTDAEAQATLTAVHLQTLSEMLDEREAPMRKVQQPIQEDSVELEYIVEEE